MSVNSLPKSTGYVNSNSNTVLLLLLLLLLIIIIIIIIIIIYYFWLHVPLSNLLLCSVCQLYLYCVGRSSRGNNKTVWRPCPSVRPFAILHYQLNRYLHFNETCYRRFSQCVFHQTEVSWKWSQWPLCFRKRFSHFLIQFSEILYRNIDVSP
jgi:hypothetical protein